MTTFFNRYRFSRVLLHSIFCLLLLLFFILFTNCTKQKPTKVTPGFPAEWAWLQRTFPHGKADRDAYPKALKQRAEMNNHLRKSRSLSWEFAGPQNISGRITDIEYNPKNPQIVYAAAATGGVFKSLDGTNTWQPVFDDQALLTVGDLAVDPINPDIIYVGTGEANGGHNNFPGNGIYKSNDAGYSWQHIGLDSTVSIGRILVSPTNPDSIFVAAVGSYFEPNPQRGIFISPDGGQSWEQSLFISDSTGAIDLVMDTNNPRFMVAAMWERVRRPVDMKDTHLHGKSSGIYRTFNGGQTWQFLGVANGLPDANTENVGRIGLSLYSGDTRVLYALYTDGNLITGLYRSNDDGFNWQETGGSAELRDGAGTFSWYFGQVRVHPLNPEMIYVLDVSFMRSSDGGKTWPVRYGYSGPDYLHVDHHALDFHPVEPDTILSGNDGGLNLSYNSGMNWRPSPPMPISQFYEIGLDFQNPDRLYGGTQDNGSIRTSSGGLSDWQRILGGDGFYVLVDPQDDRTIYAEYQFGGLHKSTDGGNNFNYIVNSQMESEPRNWSTPVAMDPQNSAVLYYGTNCIWRSENSGQSWLAISSDLSRGLNDTRVGTITTIAIAPSNTSVIYAGTADGQVWFSDDYGSSWQNISETLPFRWVTRIAIDPNDAGIVYVTYSGLRWGEAQSHLFRSTDYGSNWQDISSGLPDVPLNAIAINPGDTEIFFVGSDLGVFLSINSGQSWEIAGTGLPAVVVNDLKIHPTTRNLVAGTHGRSMYKLDIKSLTDLESPIPLPKQFTLEQNYPNPFNPTTRIKYQITQQADVKLMVHNSLGQLVSILVDSRQEAGNYSVVFEAKSLPSAIYFFTLTVGTKKILTRKMVLMR